MIYVKKMLSYFSFKKLNKLVYNFIDLNYYIRVVILDYPSIYFIVL